MSYKKRIHLTRALQHFQMPFWSRERRERTYGWFGNPIVPNAHAGFLFCAGSGCVGFLQRAERYIYPAALSFFFSSPSLPPSRRHSSFLLPTGLASELRTLSILLLLSTTVLSCIQTFYLPLIYVGAFPKIPSVPHLPSVSAS